jgi:AcrR family transcriptional regulator
MSSPGGSGRRADAVRNRQLALQAATALLAEPGTPLTVEAIATKAGLGAGTVVRAFGGKDALLDAAVSGLLEPVVRRARALLAEASPEQALRTFLTELIAFQSAHHAISAQLGGLNLPATTALRAELARAGQKMITAAQRDGAVRTDIDPAVTAAMIGEAAYAIARTRPASQELAGAFITVLMDGLRPQPSAQGGGAYRRPDVPQRLRVPAPGRADQPGVPDRVGPADGDLPHLTRPRGSTPTAWDSSAITSAGSRTGARSTNTAAHPLRSE